MQSERGGFRNFLISMENTILVPNNISRLTPVYQAINDGMAICVAILVFRNSPLLGALTGAFFTLPALIGSRVFNHIQIDLGGKDHNGKN